MVFPSYSCVLCSLQLEETLEHLFLECPFDQTSWGILNVIIPQGSHFEVLESFRLQLNVNFFMDIIIMMSWCTWMGRNDFIFKNKQPDLSSVKERFKKEFA
jgi:hypothetical protein